MTHQRLTTGCSGRSAARPAAEPGALDAGTVCSENEHWSLTTRPTNGLSEPEHIRYVLKRVEKEVEALRSDVPETIKLKEAELTFEERRLASFVDFIGEGRGAGTKVFQGPPSDGSAIA